MKSDAANEVIVVGAGAAGLMAAIRAAERGKRVLLLEKNTKPGVKILMSGGTRCNLTHAADRRTLTDAFPRHQARFLRSPLAALGPEELVDRFHVEGLATKVESTGKVFPTSNRALDVQRTLLGMFQRAGAKLVLGVAVTGIEPAVDGFVVSTDADEYHCRSVVLATGGQSYPGCGTTGDGYAWAKSLGHSIVPPRPALVPLKTTDDWAHELSGLTLPDVGVSITKPGERKPLAARRGSLLFTHIGLSGPVAMDLSREVTAHARSAGLQVVCDFLPDRTQEQLLDELRQLSGRRVIRGLVAEWLPTRLADALVVQAGVPLDRVAAELSKAERQSLIDQIKRSKFDVNGTLGFAKAEVTAGGVSLSEVDSRDMQSKCTPGLYLVGEVLDIDGPIGGYNFQAAFSTGWLAGDSV
ncbi:NAD(P)/FAD-dependent oxidoreductase [Aeoliella sp. ICT_H6.2]|uniref:NAD(P)/FAD-dependent oxidoreductase n=1 Tax=Aeoliella straminimaris TaxID=2954799 RepID=A0A9X2FI04_9BACT|nr:NAD(P)/FAD-dependent oxidoreductase [Aeoliella straminimaris]